MKLKRKWDSKDLLPQPSLAPLYLSLFRDVESILKTVEKRITDLETWARTHQERELKSIESMLRIFGGK